MEHHVTATQARVHFGALLRRVVADGECVVVERSGQPTAVLLSIGEYRRLKSASNQAPGHQRLALAREARHRTALELAGKIPPLPEDLLNELREDRRDHFPDLR